MNTKTIIGTVGVAVALVLGVVNFQKGDPTIQVNVPPANPTPVQVVNNVPELAVPEINVAPARVTVESPSVQNAPTLGAVATLDLVSGKRFCQNGVCEVRESRTMGRATTTPVGILSPNATSTLMSLGIDISVGTSTAGLFTIATSTVPNATTSVIYGEFTVAANKKFSTILLATSTISSTYYVLPPNTWVNIGVKGGLGGHTYTGSVDAIFREI